MIKKLGIPKEVKQDEGRVALIPEHITQFTGLADIFVETQAGVGSGFTDEDYKQAGAKIVSSAEELYGTAQIICKVKEPQPEEFELLNSDHVLFGYLHLASNLSLTKILLEKKLTGIATEMIMSGKEYPLLIPMSKIAGNLAIQKGMQFLEYSSKGKGLLLSSISDEKNSKVTVIGCGEVGRSSIHKSIQIGASVTAIDINEDILNELKNQYGENITTLVSGSESATNAIRSADLVVGAVLLPGRKPPIVITEEDINSMEKGSVIVDVAIDQGGCVENIQKTTHTKPIYKHCGVNLYAVTNMPGKVPRTSTYALTNATFGFALKLANDGLDGALESSAPLTKGLNTFGGKIYCSAVSRSLGFEAYNV